MPRLGNKTSTKETENVKKLVGNKDVHYIEHLSRQAVEEHNDISVLYFELDWDKSKRNFYGELLVKKFKTTKGVALKVNPFIKENQGTVTNGIINQLLDLNVAVYVEQLKELNIEPKLDDFFAWGQRIYRIHTRSINDTGVSGNLFADRKRVEVKYYCYQVDDEELQKDIWGDNLGLESQLNSFKGDPGKF